MSGGAGVRKWVQFLFWWCNLIITCNFCLKARFPFWAGFTFGEKLVALSAAQLYLFIWASNDFLSSNGFIPEIHTKDHFFT